MDSTNTSIQHVSDTAYWMASYRVKEDERKDALFRDPLANVLVGEYGHRITDSMRPISRYSYWTLVIRTRVIDEYILKYINQGYATIINLGAGLDTRPYRLNLPETINWIEIDFPDVIEYKNEKLRDETPCCRLERIGCDLSDHTQRQKLFNELNQRIGPAVILTEGLIPYLTETLVNELASDLKVCSNFKVWIGEYYSPKVYPRYQSEDFRKLLGDSPFQFFPVDWITFFKDCGWHKKEMRYLYDEGEKLGRRFPLPWWAKIVGYLMGRKKLLENIRVSAYIVFEKI